MAAYAALVSLMNNIEQIQRHTRLPIHFNQKQSESLLEKVNFLIDFLEGYNYSHGVCQEMKDLESLITDVAYAAEDIIETHVVDTINDYSRSIKREDEITAETEKNSTPSYLSCLEKVMEDMDFIKDEAKEMKDKKEIENPQPRNPITSPLISSVPAGKNTTVGFDDELKRIIERLTAHERSRQVIPMGGMGGMGKTTLAKTAYEKPFIGKNFDFCAWVSISQEYDMKKIILGLLPNESSQLSDNELGVLLHKSLYGRRYLIVLDDMWSLEAWMMVNLFLPDNNNGSRIIVTTRASSVATLLDSCSIEMSFLDEDQSWTLFCAKVFVQDGCPLELEEVGRKIVKNCQGLPLSIVVIGGLLAKSERKNEYWEYIARDTTTIINFADNEQCMKILSLSYQNLPVHLKPCFLYIAAFPEDEEILASMLIKLWVAEGFLKSNCSKDLEVLGADYLNDLISRNLIMVDRRGLNGKIKSCMIHDLLRDICLQRAENDKFMYAYKLCSHDNLEFIGSQRRISFHKSVWNEETIPEVINTLRLGSMARTLICDDIQEVLPLQNFRLMRVLNYINAIRYSLHDIFQLVNSRLITIEPITGPTIFPSSLCLLWNLQILIILGISGGTIVPLEIWEMTELRHLEFKFWGIYLPNPPPNQQMNTQEGDAAMKNLRKLKGIKDFRFSYEVVKRIPNIKKLKIDYELTGKELEGCLKNLGLLVNLESLDLSFKKQISSDLLSNLTFPNSLKKFSLSGCGIHWEDMSMIGSLPHLEVLELDANSFIGPKWVLVEEGFPCLKSLQILFCNALVQWIAEDTHFPCLEHLGLHGLTQLVEIPSGIGDIPTLQKIELFFCNKSAVISAKKILEEQENLGNVSLQVQVYCDKDDELESLASDNFLVDTCGH